MTTASRSARIWRIRIIQTVLGFALLLLIPVVLRMSWSKFADLLTLPALRFFSIGIIATTIVSLFAILFSLPLATLLALGRLSHYGWIRYPCILVIEVVRALPLLLLIFYINLRFPGIQTLEKVRFGTPDGYVYLVVSTIFSQAGLAVVIALTIYTAAVNAELLRSGILSLDSGQSEAARSLGLNYVQTQRHVILPQAFRRILAPLIAQFTILLKDTSLGAIIGFLELLRRGQIWYKQNNSIMETLYVVAMLYFVINYVLGLSRKLVERRGPSVEVSPVDA